MASHEISAGRQPSWLFLDLWGRLAATTPWCIAFLILLLGSQMAEGLPGSANGSREERLAVFGRVRDELASRLRQFPNLGTHGLSEHAAGKRQLHVPLRAPVLIAAPVHLDVVEVPRRLERPQSGFAHSHLEAAPELRAARAAA